MEGDCIVVEPEDVPTDPDFDFGLRIDGLCEDEQPVKTSFDHENKLSVGSTHTDSNDAELIVSSDKKEGTIEQQITCHPALCGENVERKQYSEREITYNLLLRKLVDEFFDRTITYSHQPRSVLAALKNILERNFPEFGDSFHRERICAYLKACRRNAKKKNGEPFVRISARYLSAGMATRLADQIYLKERENLVKFTKPKCGEQKNARKPLLSTEQRETQKVVPALQHPTQISFTTPMFPQPPPPPFSNGDLQQTTLAPSTICVDNPVPGSAERTFAKLLTQTAEFLLLVADRLEAGETLFSILNPLSSSHT
ncbi:unnamed protein product [Calicophoron daubneyi]|uniref:Nucleolar protein 4 helical domain-containing protein n=1 Tax=Calicophoron daubneyi TaxID=300641 RepID=A0AAV2TQ50_CALDB